MDIITRIQNLTLEKRMLLSRRLKEECFSQSIGTSESAPITQDDVFPEISDIQDSRSDIPGRIESQARLHSTHGSMQRSVAYLVLSTEYRPTIPAAASKYSSDVMDNRNGEQTERGTDFFESELKKFLRERLPHYMIPSVFVVLEELPRTNTGKVNYQALPNPSVFKDRSDHQYVRPTTVTQQQLQAIWSAALGISEIGIGDNIFALGGHSLLLAQIVSQIRSALGVDLPLRNLFDYPTIETLSEAIDTLLWTKKENRAPHHRPSSSREQFEI